MVTPFSAPPARLWFLTTVKPLPRWFSLEQVMGVEPTSSAWKADVLAVVRQPRNNSTYYTHLRGCLSSPGVGHLPILPIYPFTHLPIWQLLYPQPLCKIRMCCCKYDLMIYLSCKWLLYHRREGAVVYNRSKAIKESWKIWIASKDEKTWQGEKKWLTIL